MFCVCSAPASDVSVIVSAYNGVRPQPRGLPTGESCRPRQGDWVLPRRAKKWLSSSWARGHRGSLLPISTVCTPRALPSERQKKKKNARAHAHTHLKVATWKELSDHRMPPHLRPDLGPKQTKKTKRALIQTILLALLPWNGTLGGERGENQPQSLMCHYKHKNRLLTLPTDVEPVYFCHYNSSREWSGRCKWCFLLYYRGYCAAASSFLLIYYSDVNRVEKDFFFCTDQNRGLKTCQVRFLILYLSPIFKSLKSNRVHTFPNSLFLNVQ